LCLIYLSLLPATTIGMGALIAIGVLLMILIGHGDETGLHHEIQRHGDGAVDLPVNH
jgi:hypothetical protein